MKKKISIAFAIVAVLIGSVYALYRYQFPYGIDHRCDKILWFVLREYAEKHGGNFPSGEETPEASISLIHSLDDSGSENAYLLRPWDLSEGVVRQRLKSGHLLDPQTCGWNYVEGLRIDSNPQLALFWDKEGVSEIGQRLSGGGHVVTYVISSSEHIPASDWDKLIEKQRKLLAEEKKKMEKGKPTRNTDIYWPQDQTK